MYNLSVVKEDCRRVVNNMGLGLAPLYGKSVLITGANGLIGSFLADLMCYLNDVCNFGMEICLTSYSSHTKAERIQHLIEREDISYFPWDCSEPVATGNLPLKVDYAFFCSGYGQPSKFLKNNVKTALINTVGVESILSYMADNNGGNFLFLSTSEIYGDPPDNMVPTPESYGGSYDFHSNRAAYKESKKLGEVICKEYSRSPNMRTRAARVALTYGPGALKTDQRVLQEFIFKAHNNREIQMLDEGKSIRNYLYITDSAEILLNILLHGQEMVYNVGGDTEPITIFNLASTIANKFQVPVRKGTTPDTVNKSAPRNVGLAMNLYRREFIQYGENIVKMETGIANTIKWFNFKGE